MNREPVHPIVFFNGTVVTTNGLYRITDLPLDEARKLAAEHDRISAIGHEATAEVLSEILGVHVPFNRIQFRQEVGQQAIVFKLNVRPVEGVILSKDQIEEIGYSLKLMERLD